MHIFAVLNAYYKYSEDMLHYLKEIAFKDCRLTPPPIHNLIYLFYYYYEQWRTAKIWLKNCIVSLTCLFKLLFGSFTLLDIK